MPWLPMQFDLHALHPLCSSSRIIAMKQVQHACSHAGLITAAPC